MTDYDLFTTILELVDHMLLEAGEDGLHRTMIPSNNGLTISVVVGHSGEWLAYFYPDGELLEARVKDVWLKRTDLEEFLRDRWWPGRS